MTIELRLIAAVPAVSLLARLMLAEAPLITEKLSATDVGGVGVAVIAIDTVATFEVSPLSSLTVYVNESVRAAPPLCV